jgi:hypothetical protein
LYKSDKLHDDAKGFLLSSMEFAMISNVISEFSSFQIEILSFEKLNHHCKVDFSSNFAFICVLIFSLSFD